MTMEEEQKRNWRVTRFNNSETQSDIESIINGKRRTALQNLAIRYKRFSYLSLASLLMCATLAQPHILPNSTIKWVVIGLFSFNMLLASCMDHWLYTGISSIDLTTMPVAEVARRAAYYRKRHIQFIFVLLPIAMVTIGGMCWLALSKGDILSADCMFIGAAVGLSIGIRQLHKFMADYRDITRE